jgi:hypothetical protein
MTADGSVAPLETLFDLKRGRVLPLPPELSRLYGSFRMPLPRSGPRVFSNFGRDAGDGRLSLVMGKTCAPRDPLWGTLVDARRCSKLMFLRYFFPTAH